MHPAKKDECLDKFERLFAGENIGEFETIFIAKDGSEIHVRGTSNGTCKEDSLQQTRGIFKNITAIQEMEELQRLSAQIFENTKEGVLVTDPHRRITSANKAFVEISGYTEEEILGKDAKDFFVLEHGTPSILRVLIIALEKGMYWQGEILAYKKNGLQITTSVSISAVTSRHGNISRYICFI